MTKRLTNLAKIIKTMLIICLASTLPALGYERSNHLVSPDTKTRLKQIEIKRKELQKKLSLTKKKERIAILQLNFLKSKLNKTTKVLNNSKNELNHTDSALNQCQEKLAKTQDNYTDFTKQASYRLRQIYEGHRIGFIEMLFQVNSLPSLLDFLYYQEKIANEDKNLLESLKAKSDALNQAKNNLGNKKSWLENFVDEVAQRARAIFQAKETQEEMARKLQSQREFYEQAERQLEIESKRLETHINTMESNYEKSTVTKRAGTGHFKLPITARMSCPFGWRVHPIFRTRKFHTGVDLAGKNKTPVHAADNGHVLFTGWYGGYGKVVIISHGNELSTLYAHMSQVAVSAGENVNQGDIVGYEGSTGFSTGPHVHFEVRVKGKPNNPLNYVSN